MCILAIETTTPSSSYAILHDNKIVFQDYCKLATGHSENIMVRIDNALNTLEINKTDIKAVCVSNGPGSFTGCRVGLATAKGICTGLQIPLVAFNSLELLAANVYGSSSNIMSVLDARMNEVYVAVFDKDLNTIIEPHIISRDTIYGVSTDDCLCVGAVHLLPNTFKKALPHQNILAASSMFSLLAIKNITPKYDEEYISNLEPCYVRKV
jgi:tRNA threonylcarbamoyladenosine biosynthesis protein TsaB